MGKIRFAYDIPRHGQNAHDELVDTLMRDLYKEIERLPKLAPPFVYMPTCSRFVEDENGNMKVIFNIEVKDMTPISFED